MLDLSLATDTGTLSIPDRKANNPATQATAGRKPTLATAANGQRIATFATSAPSQLTWPIAANNNSTTKWGFACWFKAVSYPPFKCLLSIGGATGAYDNCKAEIYLNNTRRCDVYFFGQDSSGYTGRQGVTAGNALPAVGNWAALRVQFDGTQATEALRHKVFLDGVDQALTYSNVGAGGTPVALRSNAGAVPMILGNYQNDADTTFAADFVLGPRVWIFNGSPNGADALAMMNAVKPT